MKKTAQGATMREQCPEINWERGIALVGDEDLYLELLQDYEGVISKALEDIQNAIACRDTDTVLMKSHGIKGSSGNLALPRVAECAACMEKAARENLTGEFPDMFVRLREAIGQVCTILRREFDSQPERG
jgi:HPt (histidine-containing phosphotransfer) domain-containing protein